MNILVNPSGKAMAFRAVDWVVELLNLYIKVQHFASPFCAHCSPILGYLWGRGIELLEEADPSRVKHRVAASRQPRKP